MLYDGKGLIEVVQQLAPLLVVLRTAKAHGVVLQAVPFHEQQVGARALQAPRQCQAPEAGHARNDPLGLPEGGLEVILVARSDRQQRMLESHFAMVAVVAVGPAVRVLPRATSTLPSHRGIGIWRQKPPAGRYSLRQPVRSGASVEFGDQPLGCHHSV